MMNKIIRHPLWSAVIASLIISLGSIVYAKIISIQEKISFNKAINQLLNVEISLRTILVAIASLLFINLIVNRLFFYSKFSLSRKRKLAARFDRIENKVQNTLITWKVYFKDNGDPFIDDLEIFCREHEPPIRFIGDCCSIMGCKNNRHTINHYGIKNHMESMVLDYWRRLS